MTDVFCEAKAKMLKKRAEKKQNFYSVTAAIQGNVRIDSSKTTNG